MKRIKKIMISILLGLLAIIIIPIAFTGLRIVVDLGNPLRQPEEQIREELLLITPIGTNMGEAAGLLREIGNERNWGQIRVNDRVGVLHTAVGLPIRSEDIALNRSTVVGEYSIRVSLGGFRNVFVTGVNAWWAFDENSELIEVFVQRHISGW